MISVLFVCMGNICRSPTAEGIFQKYVSDAGLSDQIKIDSAGTTGYHAGEPADSRMKRAASQRGYELLSRSRQIKVSDLRDFDYIIVMDSDNEHYVRQLDRSEEYQERIKLMTDYCSEFDYNHVPDPYYGGEDGFKLVMDLLEDACEGFLSEIKNKL